MADATASITAQSLSLTQAKVNAHWYAVKSLAFGLPHSLILYAQPAINYKRNVASSPQVFGVQHRPLGFGASVTNYKRIITSKPASMPLGRPVYSAIPIVNVRSNYKIMSPSALVQVRIGASQGGADHTYTETKIDTVTKLPTTVTMIFKVTTEIIFNIPGMLSDRPHLLWPLYGTNHRTASPLMRWTPVRGAVRYEVYIARNINFLDRVIRFDTTITEILRGLPFDSAFYWYVRGVSLTGAYSPFSEVWYFTTSPISPSQELAHTAAARSRLLWQFQENAGA